MRVLLAVDAAHDAIPGGHRVQVDRTADALGRLGVDVRVAPATPGNLEGIDLLHSMGASLEQITDARTQRIPVAVSTLYCSQDYILGGIPDANLTRRARRVARNAAGTLRYGPRSWAERNAGSVTVKRDSFAAADLLLPNSTLEADTIRSDLGVATAMHVVPNGVDHRVFTPPAQDTSRSGVLYVGRLEPHKNQLGLITALHGSGIPLVIVGGPHPHHLDYVQECHAAADGSVTFVDQTDQASLVELYQTTAVHAMPSWYETTGLSSLEAALCGAAVVSTCRGYASEYFGDLVEWCDPEQPASIRAAVTAAITNGPHDGLRDRILGNFTWDHAAAATLAAYRAVLDRTETSGLTLL